MRAWGKVKFKQFKFKDAVAEKGNKARIHMGAIANEDADSVMQAFASEGLDARNYGLFCYDEWDDQYEDVQVLVTPEVVESVKVVDREARYKSVMREDGSIYEEEIEPEVSHMENKVTKEAVYRSEKQLKVPAGHKYSLRYEECLVLECAYHRWRLEQLEARLGA